MFGWLTAVARAGMGRGAWARGETVVPETHLAGSYVFDWPVVVRKFLLVFWPMEKSVFRNLTGGESP